jgi:hypothetical protein
MSGSPENRNRWFRAKKEPSARVANACHRNPPLANLRTRPSHSSAASFGAVSQLLWPEKDREVWFSLEENHEEAYCLPDFLQRGTG